MKIRQAKKVVRNIGRLKYKKSTIDKASKVENKRKAMW